MAQRPGTAPRHGTAGPKQCWGLSPGRTTEEIVSINHLIKLSPALLGTNATEFQPWEAEVHPPALGHDGSLQTLPVTVPRSQRRFQVGSLPRERNEEYAATLSL